MKGFAYVRLIIAALLEPFIYHPLIVFFSLRGYMKFLTKQRIVWGEMTRQGFANKQPGHHGGANAANPSAGAAPGGDVQPVTA